eukprot:3198450-Rhodomonas_salina.2
MVQRFTAWAKSDPAVLRFLLDENAMGVLACMGRSEDASSKVAAELCMSLLLLEDPTLQGNASWRVRQFLAQTNLSERNARASAMELAKRVWERGLSSASVGDASASHEEWALLLVQLVQQEAFTDFLPQLLQLLARALAAAPERWEQEGGHAVVQHAIRGAALRGQLAAAAAAECALALKEMVTGAHDVFACNGLQGVVHAEALPPLIEMLRASPREARREAMADLGRLIAATKVDNMHAVCKPGWADALLKLAYGTVLHADAEAADGEKQGLLEEACALVEVVVTHHPAASSSEHPWAVARAAIAALGRLTLPGPEQAVLDQSARRVLRAWTEVLKQEETEEGGTLHAQLEAEIRQVEVLNEDCDLQLHGATVGLVMLELDRVLGRWEEPRAQHTLEPIVARAAQHWAALQQKQGAEERGGEEGAAQLSEKALTRVLHRLVRALPLFGKPGGIGGWGWLEDGPGGGMGNFWGDGMSWRLDPFESNSRQRRRI